MIRIPVDKATLKYWSSFGSIVDIERHETLMAALLVVSFNYTKKPIHHQSPIAHHPSPIPEKHDLILKIKSPVIAQFCQTTPSVVAAILARLWREDLFKSVYAEYSVGLPFKESIMQYCAMHNIEVDIDINYDAMERKFRRDCKRKQGQKRCFFLENMRRNVLIISKKMHPSKQPKNHYSDENLDNIAKAYFTQNEGNFYTKRGTLSKKLYFQLRIYVYHQIGGRSYTYIMKRFKTYPSKIYYNINSFKAFLAVSPPIEG